MKKIAILLVALLMCACLFMACGEQEITTPDQTTPGSTTPASTTSQTESSTTLPDSSTTEPAQSTPESSSVASTDDPDSGAIDIINNMEDMDYNVVQNNYDGFKAFAFEDFHVDLDYHVALVIKMLESPVSLYEEFFITLDEEDNGQYEINQSYRWEVVIDGEAIEIERITLANYRTSGWVRLDLGEDFSFNNYEYEDGVHMYDVRINIYDANAKLAYYAYLTDPEYNGLFSHKKPVPFEIIPDPTRPTDVVALDQENITPVGGPTPGSGENYMNLFDDTVRTKLCTGDNGVDNAIIAKINTECTIVGISLVNANDNATYNSRTLVDFEIWVSADSNNWGDAPVATFSGEGVDKSSISGNFQERYYALETPINASYIRIVANNGDTYQISELLFYIEK